MSANTIKISTQMGDKYIQPQETLTYKNITLFGYGYLDWGRIVNQSIATLMDTIDSLQDSNFSEIQFDLTEYEEEQKRLRALEFQEWKVGFSNTLKNMVASYEDGFKEEISNVVEAQNLINSKVNEDILNNYTELKDGLDELQQNLDERIMNLINGQVDSLVIKLENLTSLVESTKTTLENATVAMNETKTAAEQLISNFKTEFNSIFEKFKEDTNLALIENKDYLIKYVDEKLAGYSSINNDFEDRIMSLELVSGSLNPASIRDMIISRVNEISSGIIANSLNSFEIRLSSLEDDLSDMNSSIDNKIAIELKNLDDTYGLKFETVNNSISNLSQRVTGTENDLIPLNKMVIKADELFIDPEDSIIQIDKNKSKINNSHALVNGLILNYKNIFKNNTEALLNQIKLNTERNQLVLNDTIINLVEGLRNTSFDELSLIKRKTSKQDLQNKLFDQIKNSIYQYSGSNLKFTSMAFENGNFYFAFKLPYISNMLLWKTLSVRITCKRTNESIFIPYQVTDSFMSNQNIDYYGENPANGIVNTPKAKPFIYNLNANCSQLVSIKFDNYETTDEFKFDFYSEDTGTNLIVTKTLDVGYVVGGSYTNYDFTDDFYPVFVLENDNISIPNPILVDPTFSITNTKILVPINKISTNQTGSKELCIKVGLPNGATLTNLKIEDGFSTQTKNFTNHNTFPISENDYTTRNLGSTNNYYKDICTTGVLYFPINSNSKTVKTTITYVLGGVTKTELVTTAGTGGGNTRAEIEVDIDTNNYTEISTDTYFGANPDGKKIKVDVKVYDNTSTSETYQMWINGGNLSTVAIKNNGTVRIYNEYTEMLKFFIILEYPV